MIDVLEKVIKQLLSLEAMQGVPVYLIGGTVRDLLLNRELARDFDFVVLGDAMQFARAYAATCCAEIVCHEKFGTATVTNISGFSEDLALDFVSARRESYPKPGALPLITFGSLEDDIKRRDFTVNALAVELAPELPSVLSREECRRAFRSLVIDLAGGLDDLDKKQIRVLHDKSFVDDPTRIFRAARYAARLGASISSETESSLQLALASGALTTISNDRMLRELRLILCEDVSIEALTLIESWGVSEFLPVTLPLEICKTLHKEFGMSSLQGQNHLWEYAVLLQARPQERKELLSVFGFGKKWFRKFEQDLEKVKNHVFEGVPESLLYALCVVNSEDSSVASIKQFLDRP